MFELTVARKYLVPRWRQLSVSIISLISILVIALVVWLLLVFFSVTHGLERGWIQKLTALTAPVRVVPTDDYYNSFYYKVDSISAGSDYSLKTIGEKLRAVSTNPYNSEFDEEPPVYWEKPDLAADGQLKDLVREAYASIHEVPGLRAHDYEVTASNLRIRLLRHTGPFPTQAFMTQATYLGSLDPNNTAVTRTVLSTSTEDLENLFHMLAIASDNIQEDFAETFNYLGKEAMQQKLATFFDHVKLKSVRTPNQGWRLPRKHMPAKGKLQGLAFQDGEETERIVIPETASKLKALESKLLATGANVAIVTIDLEEGYDPTVPLILENNVTMQAQVDPESIPHALKPGEVAIDVEYEVQGYKFGGITPIGSLHFDATEIVENSTGKAPLWLHKSDTELALTHDSDFGDGILLPKTFREAGVRLGDRGYLSYYTPTASSVQEQRQPVYIAGFYDPGIIPIGGKFVLANEEITALIRSSHEAEDASTTNGINVRFDDLERADEIKERIEANLAARGISQYWDVQTYREYDFTKPLLNQLQSDKTLLSIISLIIILVACSNIISMLIILVNDKKVEIGIMRAMGASSRSIATIFGFCGMIMGVVGSVIGTVAAVYTLNHIDVLVHLLSQIQGHAAFNPMFYGESLPNQLSYEALTFIVMVTAGISIIAGIVPAVKASLMRPAEILRAE